LARQWSQVVSFSPEFCSLCQAQFEVLSGLVGASRCVLYFRREDPLTGKLEFVPAAVYPQTQRVWVVGEGPEGRPSSGPVELPGFISAENLMPEYPFNMPDNADGSDISDGGISVPIQYGNTVIGMLAIWRNPSENESGEEEDSVWTREEKAHVKNIASSLALAIVLDQRNQFSYNEALQAEKLRSMLSDSLHQVKNSLSAVRMFGKLLLRRLPSDDMMNRELAKDILIQSDRMVELLVPYDSDSGRASALPYQKKPMLMLGGGKASDAPAGVDVLGTLSDSVALGPDGLIGDLSEPLESSEAQGDEEGEQHVYERLDSELAELRETTGEHQMCDVAGALSPVVSASQAIAEFDGIDFEMKIAKTLPEVRGDARILQEAMSNLMDNALKYAQIRTDREEGKARVFLKVSKLAKSRLPKGSEAGVVIMVEDDGPGVDEEELPELCVRGFRGRASLEAGTPGSGLGLHIVQELVSVMGGKLAFAKAHEDGGLKVTMTLLRPTKVEDENATGEPKPKGSKGKPKAKA